MTTEIRSQMKSLKTRVSQIRRPFHARSLITIAKCQELQQAIERREYNEPETIRLMVKVLKASQSALDSAIEAVPSLTQYIRLQTRGANAIQAFNNVSELICQCMRGCGLGDSVEKFRLDFQEATRKDQDAMVRLNEEIQRQENRQLAALSGGSAVKLKLKLCVESMDAPKDIELGHFNADTRLETILWKIAQPGAKQKIDLGDHPNFYIQKRGQHSHTKDGVLFERLTLDQQVDTLPREAGFSVVYLVTSKTPYILVTRGHSSSSHSKQSSHGLLIKDFSSSLKAVALSALKSQMSAHTDYRVQNTLTKLAVESPRWKDVIQDGFQLYKSDWLVILNQTKPDLVENTTPKPKQVESRKAEAPSRPQPIPASQPQPQKGFFRRIFGR